MATRTRPKSQPPEFDLLSLDDDAEMAVIGAIFCDPDTAIAELSKVGLRPDHMARTKNQATLRAVYDLHIAGIGIDTITVISEMKRAGTFKFIESGAYLTRAAADVPSVANIGHYAKIVRDHARKRGISDALRVAAHRLDSDTTGDETSEIAADAVAALASIDDRVDAPVVAPLPDGYFEASDTHALWRDERVTSDDKKTPAVCICPCVPRVTGRGVDVGSGEHQVTITWNLDGRTYSHTCSRSTVAATRTIVALADHGLPVTSNTASALVDYLAAAERCSRAPIRRMARACGWHGRAFLRGTHRHGADCPEWMRGDGVDTIIDSIGERGSAEEWSATVLPALQSYPVLRLMVACVVAPPLLARISETAKSWCVDVCSGAGGGKTSAMRVALSVWGHPSEYQQEWGATRVGIERVSAALNGLPIALDDTKKAPSGTFASQVVYDVISGRGKLRGSVKGAQRTARFQSVLISTGEGPMNSAASDAGGSRRRTLTIDADPWNGRSPELGAMVRTLEHVTHLHYGHAGRMVIDRLVAQTADDQRDMQARWHTLADHYMRALAARLTDTTAPVDSCAQYLATAQLAGELLCDVMKWPALDWVDVTMIARIARSLGEVDRARAALEHALHWLAANPARVQGQAHRDRDNVELLPSQGWIGIRRPKFVAFFPTALDSELKRVGYDAAAALGAWFDRGWLECSPKRRTWCVRNDGATAYVVRIHNAIVAEIEAGDDAATTATHAEDHP